MSGGSGGAWREGAGGAGSGVVAELRSWRR